MTYSWIEFHGALTHFPIALLITALAFEVGSFLFKKPEWRMISFWLIIGSAVIAIPSVLTGLKSSGQMFGSHPPPLLPTHRLAGYVTLGGSILAAALRIAQRNSNSTPAIVSSLVVLLIAASAAGYAGYIGGKMVFGSSMPSNSTTAPVVPANVKTPTEPANLIAQGQSAYAANGCQSCHSLNGVGGHAGPNLTHEAARNASMSWQIEHLKNPSSVRPGSQMPPYNSLPASTLKALAAFLVTRR